MLPAADRRGAPGATSTRAYRKFLTASVGVTPFSSRVPFDLAIEQADRVMYERKKALKQMRGTPARRDTEPRERYRQLNYYWTDCPRCHCHVAVNSSSFADRVSGSLRRWSADRTINDGRMFEIQAAQLPPGGDS